MATQANGRRKLRFSIFEVDLAAGEMCKRGVPLPVQEKPFQILAHLLERPGEIVTREELQKRLWPNGTYVDFDKGLNTAVKKLRYALGDSPDKPVFIETIPRRGYRFIAPVSGNGSLPDEPPAGEPTFPTSTAGKNPVTVAPNLVSAPSFNRSASGNTGTHCLLFSLVLPQ